MGDPDVWPLLLEMTRDECKRILRRLELEAYSNLVSVLRAQGSLTPQKRRLLQNVAQTLSISEERHKAECRRAVNSEKLATIAKQMGGANSGTEWAIEGRRLVPLLPRLVPQTAFTAIADKVANMAMTEGAKLPLPTPPVKKRLSSPPIDETLLEPNVPEASKTLQISSGSPLSVTIPSSELHHQSSKLSATNFLDSPQPPQVSPLISKQLLQDADSIVPRTNLPSSSDFSQPDQIKQEGSSGQSSHTFQTALPPVSPGASQHLVQTSQQSLQKSQVVLFVKKEEKSQEERLSRKRPRSASLDMALNIPAQGSMLPPPVKKEAISPLSPLGSASPLGQLPPTISPQSHSQLVQQQTLQAAAVAAAAASASSQQVQSPVPHQQVQHHQTPSQPSAPVPLQSSQLQQQPPPPQTSSTLSNASQPSNTSSNSSRTITIPSQGTVKLSLSTTTPNSVTGIPSGTHKVIIVSSTTPSILQRSLSVPVVKSLSTNAPSQNSPATLALNTAQQTHQATSTATSSSVDTSFNTTPAVSTSLPSKVSGKLFSQSTPKTRPRANSIVIPVTPNQANVMSGVGVTSVQLKSALQAGKPAVLKSGETGGLKIMPLSNVGSNSKLLPKAAGSTPVYVVGSTSTASPTVSMVARTVSSGQRVMTFTSSLPKVAVSTSQGSNVISMSSKPVQTLQLSQPGSVVTSSGSIPLSTSGKPNVIVVQKGSTAFGRGVTLTHGGKEVVGKVLLGGKALTSLNPGQVQNSAQVVTTSLNQTSNLLSQVVATQAGTSSTLQLSQSSTPVTTSAPTRVVTVQKYPNTQGAGGSGNVIVLDLSQEQLNNSAVLNEILASSILQSSSVMNFNHGAVGDPGVTSINSLKGLLNFPTEQSGTDSGAQSSNGNTSQTTRSHTDICATAMSNANLNFNDLMDESSLDGMQGLSLDGMKMDLAPESDSNPSNIGTGEGTNENWVRNAESLPTDSSDFS